MPVPSPRPLPLGGVDALDHSAIRALLADARQRTLWLIEPISDRDMNRVHDKLMSPLVWDLGHIAAFEDLWLCHTAGGLDPLRPGADERLRRDGDPARRPRRHPLPAAARGVHVPRGGPRAHARRPRAHRPVRRRRPAERARARLGHDRPAREPAQRDDAADAQARGTGHVLAGPPAAARAAAVLGRGPQGADPRRAVRAGRGDRLVLRLRQRAAASYGRRRRLRDRRHAGVERRLPQVRRVGRLRPPRVVVGRRLGVARDERGRAPALLDGRRLRALVRPHRGDRPAPPR